MELSALLSGVKITLPNTTITSVNSQNLNFSNIVPGVAIDTKKITPGGIFICQKGEHYDGHCFANQAVTLGAKWIISQYSLALPDGVQNILCENTHLAAAVIFDNFFGNPASAMKSVAVTGTNGKSSVVHMLAQILEHVGYNTGTLGTVGNCVGKNCLPSAMTTLTVDLFYEQLARLKSGGVTHLVMEASSHSLAYDKLYPIVFNVGIFTNLTPEHLDFHHDMQSYARAKAKLFSQSINSVINLDDNAFSTMANSALGKIYSFSTKSINADLFAHNIKSKITGNEYYAIYENGSTKIRTSIPGTFTISNSLGAYLAARLLCVSDHEIASAFSIMNSVRGRMEKVELNADFSVFIDYAHTPDALNSVLLNLKAIKSGTLTVVFGCGGDRDKTKRPVMGDIAATIADRAIITSDNSRSESPDDIICDIVAGISNMKNVSIIQNRKMAIEYAIESATFAELILIAGKGHEDYEITKEGKLPFNEREIIIQAYKNRKARKEKT